MSVSLQPADHTIADAYRSAWLVLDVPLALLDVQGCVVDVNSALCNVLGSERPILLGIALKQWLQHADIFDESWTKVWACSSDSNPPVQFAAVLQKADGTGVSGHFQLTPLGTPVNAVMARWLPQIPLGDAEAAQRQLQMFADTVAHDLRAPLRSIDSFTQLLASRVRDRLEPAEQDYLTRIRSAAARMSGLLAALGELSRTMRDEFKLSDVDLSLLAEWAIAELQEAEPTRQADVSIQPGLLVRGDERLLGQLLRALIKNAWVFSRSDQPPQITIEGQRVGDQLIVNVRDCGIGYDTRYAHKLFQPFQRLHSPDQGAGHGLGLTIADRIVRRHGGSLYSASDANGSVFTFELPAAKAEQDIPHA